MRTGSRRHRISTVFQIPGRRADSLRIGRYTNFLDITSRRSTRDGARPLFQVFADAYERQSAVITTNLEFSRWGSAFGDDQMSAVIDYIVHHGRLVQFRRESCNVRHALMQEG